MTPDATAQPRPAASRRPDLPDRLLAGLTIAAVALAAALLALKPLLGPAFQRAGTPLLQGSAILGALLLLMPFAYVVAKRGGGSASPNRWLIAHVLASLAGLVLVVLHSGGQLLSPPSVMLYALAGLVATGVNARLRTAREMAATLGRKRAAFATPDPALRERLRALIAAKQQLLARLDASAREATFSVTLRHALRRPILALRYTRLARREAVLIGARGSVGVAQAWGRPMHLALASLFLAALLVHVVAVTFFAGYVAAGRPITWWHLTAW